MAVTATESLTRAQRLDRLPFTRAHGKLLVGSGVGWALDAMDVGLISFVLAALAAQWSLRPGHLSVIASIGFAGRGQCRRADRGPGRAPRRRAAELRRVVAGRRR